MASGGVAMMNTVMTEVCLAVSRDDDAVHRSARCVVLCGLTSLLTFMAAPTFAVMALGITLLGSQSDMLCAQSRSGSGLSGMSWMYILMSIFHAGPWVKSISQHWVRDR
jgi:hypothetical protein